MFEVTGYKVDGKFYECVAPVVKLAIAFGVPDLELSYLIYALVNAPKAGMTGTCGFAVEVFGEEIDLSYEEEF